MPGVLRSESVREQVAAFKALEGLDLADAEFCNVCPHCRTVGSWKQFKPSEDNKEHWRRIAAAEGGVDSP